MKTMRTIDVPALKAIAKDYFDENKPMKIYLSTGNAKLKSNDRVRFLIWNLPSKVTCPYMTDMCGYFCYANKAERIYPSVLPRRMKNFLMAESDTFVEDMVNVIQRRIKHKSYKGKTVLFRIHESGDFYSPEYAFKWELIALQCPTVKFLAYTKSTPYFRGHTLPENLIIRASIWKDTDDELLKEYLTYPTYTALEKGTYSHDGIFYCDCTRGCGECQACWNKNLMRCVTDIS